MFTVVFMVVAGHGRFMAVSGGQIGDLPKLPALDQLCGERPHGGKESREEPEGFGGTVGWSWK